MPIHFHLKHALQVPLECDALTPDQLAEKSVAEISQLPLFSGRHQKQVADVFDVTVSDVAASDVAASDVTGTDVTGTGTGGIHLEFHGDLTRFRGIGRGMASGRITVHGSCGMHCGAEMTGGQIVVTGSTDDWLGAEMKNGTIIVHGDTGKCAGAAYVASASGMKNGTIIVHGNAGQEVGRKMRRGTIVVRGTAGDLAGLQMIGGTIILKEAIGGHLGAWMKKGTIICLQSPTTNSFFAECCDYSPTFVSIYAHHLKRYDVRLPSLNQNGQWTRFVGDISREGRGELLVWKASGR